MPFIIVHVIYDCGFQFYQVNVVLNLHWILPVTLNISKQHPVDSCTCIAAQPDLEILLQEPYCSKGQGEAYILNYKANVGGDSKLKSGFVWWDYFASSHHITPRVNNGSNKHLLAQTV